MIKSLDSNVEKCGIKYLEVWNEMLEMKEWNAIMKYWKVLN